MAEQVGLTTSRVQKLIDVYSFMVEHRETATENWSYYDSYHTNRQVQKARAANPAMDDMIVEKVKSGEIPRAVDLRDGLPKIVQSPRALKRLLSGDETFGDALYLASDRTELFKTINRFRQKIAGREFERELASLNDDQRKKCVYELRKIQQRADSLLKRAV